jgi:hypothetical protein
MPDNLKATCEIEFDKHEVKFLALNLGQGLQGVPGFQHTISLH